MGAQRGRPPLPAGRYRAGPGFSQRTLAAATPRAASDLEHQTQRRAADRRAGDQVPKVSDYPSFVGLRKRYQAILRRRALPPGVADYTH